ncbi:MAG: VCBS repeat-containing protein [Bryobacter sp.]|nr:VCBS repeat-containing protein [Bryobacter sp.]
MLTLMLMMSLAVDGWQRHTIDDELKGADGVRLADINGDGLPDVATGWEEGRTVRIYYHPPRKEARALKNWPTDTVGQVCSPEDAVFVDLDLDGRMDVVSACEDKAPTGVYVHWAPDWKTEAIPAANQARRWIYTLPLLLAGAKRPVIFAGGKLEEAKILLLEPPSAGSLRDLASWKARELTSVGWTMSLIPTDMNNDGKTDVLVSDRRGPTRGIFYLAAPGWSRVDVGALGEEVMFIDRNARGQVAAAIAPRRISVLTPTGTGAWTRTEVPYPQNAGTAKAVAWGDLNLDGRLDLAFTCENAGQGKTGVWWIESLADGGWKHHSISGEEGIKFDRIELLDVDGDGDLDLMTTEERTPLGVVWYENPIKN